MALHKNYVEANIILADSNDAFRRTICLVVFAFFMSYHAQARYNVAQKHTFTFSLDSNKQCALGELVFRVCRDVCCFNSMEKGWCGGRMNGAVMTKY
jgi:hypothetical protein